MIQITGRDWYTQIAKETGLDLLNDPDLAAAPAHLLECALAFWKLDDVNKYVGDLRAEVKRINGGYTNMAAREAWEATCAKLITVDSTNPKPIVGATGPTGGLVPTPKPPAIVNPGSMGIPNEPLGTPTLHPTFAQELAALFKKWFG